MAGNGNSVVAEVYRITGDDPNDPVIGLDTARQTLMRRVLVMSGPAAPYGLNIGPLWARPLLTIAAGNRDYVLPTSYGGSTNIEYQRVLDVVYSTGQMPLRRISREEGQAGRALGATASGKQAGYWIEVGPDQKVSLLFRGYPLLGENLDALVSIIPDDWPVTAAEDSAPVIPFSRTALAALALLTASALIPPLNPERKAALRLDVPAAEAWEREAVQLIRQERITVISLKRTHGPRNLEWVAGWVV